jgi:hypothetical protein
MSERASEWLSSDWLPGHGRLAGPNYSPAACMSTSKLAH